MKLHVLLIIINPKKPSLAKSLNLKEFEEWHEEQITLIENNPIPLFDQICEKYDENPDYDFDRKEFKRFLLDILALNQLQYIKYILPEFQKRDFKPSDYRNMSKAFISRSLDMIKDMYKDYEFDNLFDEIDVVRDGSIHKSELKFFLKKMEWYTLSPHKVKARE